MKILKKSSIIAIEIVSNPYMLFGGKKIGRMRTSPWLEHIEDFTIVYILTVLWTASWMIPPVLKTTRNSNNPIQHAAILLMPGCANCNDWLARSSLFWIDDVPVGNFFYASHFLSLTQRQGEGLPILWAARALQAVGVDEQSQSFGDAVRYGVL